MKKLTLLFCIAMVNIVPVTAYADDPQVNLSPSTQTPATGHVPSLFDTRRGTGDFYTQDGTPEDQPTEYDRHFGPSFDPDYAYLECCAGGRLDPLQLREPSDDDEVWRYLHDLAQGPENSEGFSPSMVAYFLIR